MRAIRRQERAKAKARVTALGKAKGITITHPQRGMRGVWAGQGVTLERGRREDTAPRVQPNRDWLDDWM